MDEFIAARRLYLNRSMLFGQMLTIFNLYFIMRIVGANGFSTSLAEIFPDKQPSPEWVTSSS